MISLWTNLHSVLQRVVWICHPLKPVTGFYLLTGQSWYKGTLNSLKQRMLCECPWVMAGRCGGPASPAVAPGVWPGTGGAAKAQCPAIAVGNRQ